MEFDTILFDLDGTLTEPSEGIVNALLFALAKFDISAERQDLLKFIGPPLADSFREFYRFSEEKTALAIGYYRDYFSRKGMYENQLYDGIFELLSDLKNAGKSLIVATSKPETFAIEILKYLQIADFFDFVAGATLNESRSQKADVIAYALCSCRISPARALMVGDRKFDVLGAQENGLATIGVLYGFGGCKELENAGADWIAEDVTALRQLLFSE
ncbi:HAD hydrolase-like protein [Lactococcus nasutitermitis]|uniref:HAD hydrolase-like protein n=1 Tax=Lactococcus nasutitermitis TaxID=1652957 RepID=A0ABV9JG45_9LACT|nr:HAD hydrolase-like protein [Lactococcus nasutitermitis]